MREHAPDFTDEQKNYLQGFVSGLEVRRASRGLPTFATTLELSGGTRTPGASHGPGDASISPPPEHIHRAAQDRLLAEGKKLSAEEEAKRAKNPLDMWDELEAHAAAGKFPRGTDVFLFKFQGLFYVAPAQDSFMCRLRIPNGVLSAHQLRGIADIAEVHGGGYADVTTRANLQIREIQAADLVSVLTSLHELGIVPRGAGADNIRNITGTPTAGIDLQELIDTRPLARELHHYILNHRELYGLPRKFNIAFDGGGTISSLEDTNDIGFAAVRVTEGKDAPAGVYLRVLVGGITGHGDFARDTGLLLEPSQCIPVAVAMVRVFIDAGDRTDRKKARLKYVIDRWGIEKFVKEAEARLPFQPRRLAIADCEPRGPILKRGHLGVHPQRQEGLSYVGVVLPAGRLSAGQLRGLAAIAERRGSREVRLTVWQNVLIPDIASAEVPGVLEDLAMLELGASASSVRAGLVACTGNKGCRYSATDTKGHALDLARRLEGRLELDQPVNTHFTGCPHSCAQHYIGDIGFLGVKVAAGEDQVEGYHVYLGGGHGAENGIGRELYRDVPFAELPPLVERMLRGYLARRHGEAESFRDFVIRHSTPELLTIFDGGGAPLPGSSTS
jgi:ferredoxin-nitrite reductase